MKIKYILPITLALVPSITYAVLDGISDIAESSRDIVNDYLIPIAFSCALIFFFWGVAQYIRSAGSEKEEGRKIMVWGVVAMFVISSVWGIVRFIRGELGVTQNNPIMELPKFK